MSVLVLAGLCLLSAAAPDAAAATEPSVMVLPLSARNQVTPATADLVTAMLVQHMRRHGGGRITAMREVEGTLSAELQRQVAGCDTASCAAEIASAMAADRIVIGTIGTVGENLVITASLVDARTAHVVGSTATRIRGTDEGELLDALPTVVAELMGAPTRPVAPPAARERERRQEQGSVTGSVAAADRQRRRDAARVPGSDVPEGFITFERVTTLVSTGKSVSTWQEDVPVMGPHRRRLSWEEFYAAVGREDLVPSFQKRNWTRMGLGFGGGGVLAVGLTAAALLGAAIFGVGMFAMLGSSGSSSGSLTSAIVVPGIIGGSVGAGGMVAATVVGVGMIIAARLVPPHPLSEEEIHALADDHNRAL